jgi:ribose transport system substrate-binding protein
MKKIVYITLSVILAGAMILAGCTAPVNTASPTATVAPTATAAPSEAANTTTIKTIGIDYYLSAWEFSIKQQAGLKNVADKYGIKLSEQDANSDASKQISQIEAFTTAGVDGIICVTVDGEALNPAVKKAVDKGIPFVSLYVPCADATLNMMVDEYELGKIIGGMAADWAQKNFAGKEVEIALLRMHDYKPGVERGRGMQEMLAKNFPTGKIVADVNTIDLETAMKATEAILQAHPNVKIFVCDSDDTGALGAYQVLKAKVKPEDYSQYGVFGCDGMNQAIAYMKEGGMYRGTIDVLPGKNCEIAMQFLVDLAAGKEVNKNITMELIPVDQEKAKTY